MVGPASSGIPRAPDYSGLSVYGSLQLFAYGTFTLFGLLSQHCSTKLMVCNYRIYLRIYLLQPLYPLSATSADYLTENVWANPLSLTTTQGISSISLPPDTEMFHFSGFLHTMCGAWITPGGLPHSDTCGSSVACASQQFFAAYRVLLRLSVPRHPPYALITLTLLYSSRLLSSIILSRCINYR